MAKSVMAMALAVASMITSAQAQGVGGMGGMGGMSGGGRHHQQQEKTAKTTTPTPKADTKAYNDALKSIPDKPFDAWHSLR